MVPTPEELSRRIMDKKVEKAKARLAAENNTGARSVADSVYLELRSKRRK